jgi:hypothetical protein
MKKKKALVIFDAYKGATRNPDIAADLAVAVAAMTARDFVDNARVMVERMPRSCMTEKKLKKTCAVHDVDPSAAFLITDNLDSLCVARDAGLSVVGLVRATPENKLNDARIVSRKIPIRNNLLEAGLKNHGAAAIFAAAAQSVHDIILGVQKNGGAKPRTPLIMARGTRGPKQD